LVFCTLETGIFGLISEGQLQKCKSKKKNLLKKKILQKFWVANTNFIDEIVKARKKYPVSANVKLTAKIK
jgi:predicted nucleic acid-binding protein